MASNTVNESYNMKKIQLAGTRVENELLYIFMDVVGLGSQ